MVYHALATTKMLTFIPIRTTIVLKKKVDTVLEIENLFSKAGCLVVS